MLPTGALWQNLRQRALDTVPAGAAVAFRQPMLLEDWFVRGAYTVSAVAPKRFTISAAPDELGAALCADAACYLDHAVEHSISFRNTLASGRWHSSAWSAVSIYYWSFFLVLASTRILGRTPWFVAGRAHSTLKALAPAGASIPGQGPFVLEIGPMSSATQRDVTLRQGGQTRVHDAVWSLWFAELRLLLKQPGKADAERQLYEALVLSANFLGDNWPSGLRNALNYAPGLGYGAVHGRTPAAVFGALAVERPNAFGEIAQRLAVNTRSISPHIPLLDQIPLATRVLVDLCFLMDAIAHSLLREVRERRSLDARWELSRRRFIREHGRSYELTNWPSADITI